jgi:xylulokinase
VGGGARSEYWVQAIATALGLPVELPEDGDFGGAFGAARLAMMAATGAGAEIATPPRIARVIEPATALQPAFADAQTRYRAAYAALKTL